MPALDPVRLARARVRLAALSGLQHGVFTYRQALDSGLTTAQVRTLVRRGSWLALRDGVLAEAVDDPVSRYRLTCAAALLGRGTGVISHASAWVLYQLPQVDPPHPPTWTAPHRAGLATPHSGLTSVLPREHLTRFGTLPVTSGPRTVVDVLRTAPDLLEAQALADAARRAGVEPGPVAEVLAWCTGWPGVRQAREAWGAADPRAESPLESRCRVWFRAAGLPVPESQVTLALPDGTYARVDHFFRAQRTVVEADGRVKYTDPRRGDAAAVLWREKVREDGLRDAGFEVVRATWADADDEGRALVRRVLRAFERAARRA